MFSGIRLNGAGDKGFGSFNFTLAGIEFNPIQQHHKSKNILLPDIGKVEWLEFGNLAMLQILLLDTGKLIRFDGFKSRDKDALSNLFLENCGLEIKEVELSTFALNIGELEIQDTTESMEFQLEKQKVFDIPLKGISQCALPNKGEVEIQFEDDDTAQAEDEILVQMRLHIPINDNDVDEAEIIQGKIIDHAGIRGNTGSIICTLDENIGSFLTPRGKYEVDLFESYFSMQGKTYNYKITYNSIKRIFLLDHIYGTYFVISLKRPITQGQQRYAHLVMTLSEKEEVLDLNLAEEDIEDRYDNQLSSKLEGPLPKIVARLFKALSGKKIFIPGSFRSSNEMKCVKCALKSNRGYLYPLNQSFFFVHKPATYIRYEDIENIEFLRLQPDPAQTTSNKFFDLEVTLRRSSEQLNKEKHQFNNIDKKEFPFLYNYLKKKKLEIKHFSRAEESLRNITAPTKGLEQRGTIFAMDVDDDEDSDDSDFDENKVELSSATSDSSDYDSSSTLESKQDHTPTESEPMAKRQKTSKTSRRKKVKKDPKFPKRPKTSYILFATKMSKKVKEENPGLSQPEVLKKVGERWKEISADNKKLYIELASKDKERFKKELEEYTPSPGFDKKGKFIE